MCICFYKVILNASPIDFLFLNHKDTSCSSGFQKMLGSLSGSALWEEISQAHSCCPMTTKLRTFDGCAILHLTNSSQHFPPIIGDYECIFCWLWFQSALCNNSQDLMHWYCSFINTLRRPSMHPYTHLPVHSSIHLPIWSSIHAPIHPLCIHLPIWPPIHPLANLIIHSSNHQPIHPCTHYPPFINLLSTHLPIWSSIHLFIYPPTHLSIHPPCIHLHVLLIIHSSIHPSQILGKRNQRGLGKRNKWRFAVDVKIIIESFK